MVLRQKTNGPTLTWAQTKMFQYQTLLHPKLLATPSGEFKTALVMHFRSVTAERARELLEESVGKMGEIRSIGKGEE
jgi:N-acetylmuramic acid 6-phosphate (MurNAc-6-P) etherase